MLKLFLTTFKVGLDCSGRKEVNEVKKNKHKLKPFIFITEFTLKEYQLYYIGGLAERKRTREE